MGVATITKLCIGLFIMVFDVLLCGNYVFKGSDYQKRLYQLYKLRAVSAQRLWLRAEEQKSDANIEKYKGMTKNFSREWLDFARASGQSIKEPISICVSAADKSFCEG